MLERARDALGRHDLAAARDALVEAWRARRWPALAELVELVAAQAPDDLAAKLAGLVTPRVTSTHANLRSLAGVDDPRLSGFALRALVDLPFTTPGAADLLDALADVVGRLRDPRIRARAHAIRTAVSTRIGRLAVRRALLDRVDALVAEVPEPPAPTAAEQGLLDGLAARLEPLRRTARSIDALFDEVYARPADDEPRLVLADVLQEQGDPRGELIALQIARGDGAPGEREQALLKRHGKAWLGALAPVLSWGKGYAQTRFRRGFVSTADIILSVGKKLDPIREHPAWATVEELAAGYDFELLQVAPLRGLRVLASSLSATGLEALARRPEPLAAVTRIWLNELPIDRATLRAAFPGLTTVAMHAIGAGVDLARLLALGVDHVALTHFSWPRHPVDPSIRAAFTALVGQPAPVARLTCEGLGGGWTGGPVALELRRGPDGRFVEVTPPAP